MPRYRVVAAGESIVIDVDGVREVIVNGKKIEMALLKGGAALRKIKMNGKIYDLFSEEVSPSHWTVWINHSVIDVKFEDVRADLLGRFQPAGPSQTRFDVRAPMPGFVTKVGVRTGDQVQTGSSLIILEAMKMENEIR